VKKVKVLFATDRLHIPDDFSGSVQSTHTLIQGLLALGYRCDVVASLPRRGKHFLATAVYKLSLKRLMLAWADSKSGYRVDRGSSWRFVDRVVRAIKREVPDALILDSVRALLMLAKAGIELPCPIVLVIHDVMFVSGSSELPYKDRLRIVANSPFTASVVHKHYGVDPEIVPPVVDLASYAAERATTQYVTLVSPHPRKGLDLVLEIAGRMPGLQFQLVEGWPMEAAAWQALQERLRVLPNVRLRRSTSDMRTVYGETWVLLVPSELETFGRVAVEAQVSGIPVLCNDVGALSWVVGEGGIAFASDASVDAWVNQLERLQIDPAWYGELSQRARTNTLRDDFQAESIVGRFDRVIRSCVQRHQDFSK